MESLLAIVSFIFAIYLIFKLNRVLTVSIGVINTTVELADESVQVYSGDVRINLAKKRADQIEELSDMDYVPTNEDISAILQGKSKPADVTTNKPSRDKI